MLNLLPPTCVLCGNLTKRSENLCLPCQNDLPMIPHCCQHCAQILSISPDISLKCGECLKNPPPFDKTFALFPYEMPIPELIVQLKFQHKLSHSKVFADLLVLAIRERWYRHALLPELLIPIPLHQKRLQERGFNQTLEIAKQLNKTLHIPIDYEGMIRVKSTKPQSGLSAKDRKNNMANAFLAIKSYQNKTIAVLDDVITTGRTMQEFCNILKENGAKQIHVWCCARR